MKLLAGRFRQGRRFAVGALTVGSALPRLLCAIGAVGAGIAASVRARDHERAYGVSGVACRFAGLPFGSSVFLLAPLY